MTVTYGGEGPDDVSAGVNLGTLTLSHATPIGLLSTISFTMDSTETVAPLDLTVDHLVVAATSPALAALNVDSTGNAATNEILDVSGVAANVVISGGTNLEFGDSFGQWLYPARRHNRRERDYGECDHVAFSHWAERWPTGADVYCGTRNRLC